MARSGNDMPFDNDFVDSDSGTRSFSETFDLQYYLRILRKHRFPIMLFTAVVTGLAGYYAFTATPIFRATSTLLIEEQGDNPKIFEDLIGLDTKAQDYYETQFELLQSRGLAVRVIDKLNLWDHPEFRKGGANASSGTTGDAGESADGTADNGGLVDRLKSMTGVSTASQDSGASTLSTDGESHSVDVIIDPTSDVQHSDVQDATKSNDMAQIGAVIDGEILVTDVSEPEPLELSNAEQRVVQMFLNRLGIAPVRKTKLVKISFESSSPEFAAKVANAVGKQYIESYLDSKLERTQSAQNWLNLRLRDLKTKLDESERRLIAFKQANGLVDVDNSVARLNEQQLLLVTAELAEARSDLSGKASLYREVQSMQGQPELLESIPAIQADNLVQKVKIDQGAAQRALDELKNRYGERHPRVVDARSQLDSLNNALQGHINRVVGSIAKDYQLAQQRVTAIESKLASGKEEIQLIGTKKFELDALEREVNTNREIYDAFYNRITEAKSADGLESANATISDRAVAPLNPVKPNKQLIIALAALFSLVLSVLMAFLYEQLDDTIKSTNDVEGKLGMRLLGILPLLKGGWLKRRRELPLNPISIEDKKGTFFEAVNTARTTLSMDDDKEHKHVIMVTSSVPGEGKSTTAINLAYSFAQLEKVLLIDCDMRRPTLAKAAGFDKSVMGLSNLIAQTASARECIKQGAFDGALDILPSGQLPQHPLELISSRRFARIVKQLSEYYDRIIIDSAPTQAVSDALVLSRLSDAVVYCVKSHDTSIELVKRGIERLKQVSAPLAGVLITQVDIEKITSYGGDYYYQGYYDYYGYTDKERGKSRKGKLVLSNEQLQHIREDDVEFDLGLGEKHSTRTRGRRSDAGFGQTRKWKIRDGRSDGRNSEDLDIL